MSYSLTPSERFFDRVEMLGYLTLGAAAVFLIVYFGLLFFYLPVKLQAWDLKLATFLLYAAVFLAGFGAVRHKNLARLLYLAFFLGLGADAAYEAFIRAHWLYLAVLAYAAYAYWTYSHPAAVAWFRRLRPHEERGQEGLDWLWIFTSLLTVYAAYLLFSGLMVLGAESGRLPASDPWNGLWQIIWALAILALVTGLRHLSPWARWLALAVFSAYALRFLSDSFVAQTYLQHWLVLAKLLFFLGVSLYLAFSPAVKSRFTRTPRPGTDRKGPSSPVPPPPAVAPEGRAR